MTTSHQALTDHLLTRLAQVQRTLGSEPDEPADPAVRFGEALDSMGLVEFLALVAEDCGVELGAVEEAAGRQFTTVADLTAAMIRAGMGLAPADCRPESLASIPALDKAAPASAGTCWLTATAVRLPDTVQPAHAIERALDRPRGWLEGHAGIRERRIWHGQNPLAAAEAAGRDCLQEAGLGPADVGALLVTAEAPPLLAGLAADLHHRLGLSGHATALEIGGAYTGFLAALWTARAIVSRVGPVLVVAVEVPSQFLTLEPGPAGEHAALFGDGAAAALLCDHPLGGGSVSLAEVTLGALGDAGESLRVERANGCVRLHMDGRALAGRAIRTMAESVRQLVDRHGLSVP